jgi:hypothetical protein
MSDAVNHPSHYTQGDIECIDALKAALGPEGFKQYCRGACLKYLWRTEYKNGLEDLQKCAWYLNRLIAEKMSENSVEYTQLDLGILSR